jgi:hypothetical protein
MKITLRQTAFGLLFKGLTPVEKARISQGHAERITLRGFSTTILLLLHW